MITFTRDEMDQLLRWYSHVSLEVTDNERDRLLMNKLARLVVLDEQEPEVCQHELDRQIWLDDVAKAAAQNDRWDKLMDRWDALIGKFEQQTMPRKNLLDTPPGKGPRSIDPGFYKKDRSDITP